MKKISGLLTLLLMVSISASAGVKEIKLAHVAPAGSAWDKILTEMNSELKRKSHGELFFRIYSGGVQGDEKDVIRKMRIKQIQAGGFTGNGLGQIATEFRVMELPFLFQDTDEVDYVLERITKDLEKNFLKANPSVVLLGWAEVGFNRIFSNREIRNLDDLKGLKIWQWEGDPLAAAIYSSLGTAPVPLAISDVMTALSTNMIDAVYTPPLGALAMQWASKTKYMMDLPVINSMAAVVMLRSEFKKLTPKEQKLLLEVTKKHCRKIVVKTREDNHQAIEEIKRLGVEVITVTPKDEEEIARVGQKVWKEQSDKLYSGTQLNIVQTLLEEARAKKRNAAK